MEEPLYPKIQRIANMLGIPFEDLFKTDDDCNVIGLHLVGVAKILEGVGVLTSNEGMEVEDMENVTSSEVSEDEGEALTEEEMSRARRQAESSFLWGKTSPSGLAQDLAYNQAVHGDWRYLVKYLDMVRALTPKDIQVVAAKYLVSENRTIAYLERSRK